MSVVSLLQLNKEKSLKLAALIAGLLDIIFSIRFLTLAVPLYIIRSSMEKKVEKEESLYEEEPDDSPTEETASDDDQRKLELKLFMTTVYWILGFLAIPFIIMALKLNDTKFLCFWLIIIAIKIVTTAAFVIAIMIFHEMNRNKNSVYHVDDYVNYSDLTYVLSLIVLWVVVYYYFKEVSFNSRLTSSDALYNPRNRRVDSIDSMAYHPRERRKPGRESDGHPIRAQKSTHKPLNKSAVGKPSSESLTREPSLMIIRPKSRNKR